MCLRRIGELCIMYILWKGKKTGLFILTILFSRSAASEAACPILKGV